MMLLSAVVAACLVLWYLRWRRFRAMQQAKQTPEGYWRLTERLDKLHSEVAGCTTLDQAFSKAASRFENNPCLGTREVLSEEITLVNGKEFRKQTRGEYQWQTFGEVKQRVDNTGRGLLLLCGGKRDHVAVFADSQADWQVTAQACFAQQLPFVTVYTSLANEALAHALNETEASCVITQASLVSKVVALHNKKTIKCVRSVVVFSDPVRGDKDIPASLPNLRILRLAEVEAAGAAIDTPLPEVKEDATAVIMYTSGSTGMPKGVVISHRNMVSAVAGLSDRVPSLGEKDVYVAYLPLAHVLELAAELCLLTAGASIGYSSPTTLSDTSTMIMPGTKGDVSVLRPTLMAAVPAIIERIKAGVMKKVEGSSFVIRSLFRVSCGIKSLFMRISLPTLLLDLLVFRKFRNILGGRVRMMLSGGAPLSSESEEFMNIVFCCPVGQGYGLTETCGGGTITHPDDPTHGHVGPPIGCAQIKLVPWKEGGYTPQDKPNPRGEVVIGGKHVAMGYFKNDELTDKDFKVEDGCRWFFTGDIGEIHFNGTLHIIDRRNDLIKLQHGEYVSLGKVETMSKKCDLVDNICVFADPKADFVVAVVVPNAAKLMDAARELGIEGDHEALCANTQLSDAVQKQLEADCRAAGLHKFEIPKRVHLTSVEWTPDNEMVTPALKLKRNTLNAHYKETVAQLYSAGE